MKRLNKNHKKKKKTKKVKIKMSWKSNSEENDVVCQAGCRERKEKKRTERNGGGESLAATSEAHAKAERHKITRKTRAPQ